MMREIIKVYEDQECWLGYSTEENLYFLHTEVYSWSLSKYKKYLGILSNVLKQIPAKKVYSLCQNEKTKKFNALFGFTYLGSWNNHSIMELNNVWFT